MNHPTKLADMLGNGELLTLLTRGKLPQSVLFEGPEGVGKKTIALLLAALSNCQNPEQGELCGTCRSCLKSYSGNHPDVLLFETDHTTIKIDQIRRLNQEAQYRPFEGRKRFFVIDNAEKMTVAAANSILKTLEEPPETSNIFLVTSQPQLLLPTIRSRCQTFRFHRLSRNQISQYLSQQTELNEPEMRANFSNGSIGTALELDLKTVLSERDSMLELVSCWFDKRSFAMLFEKCESSSLRAKLKNRESTKRFLDLLQTIGYDLHYLLLGTADRVVNRDRMDDLVKMSRNLSEQSVWQLLEDIVDAKKDLERYVTPLLCFETLWLANLKNS